MTDTSTTLRVARELEEVRTEAGRAAAAAETARALAREIEQRRSMLASRLEPCVRAHRADVWSSRAATASRVVLMWGVGGEVHEAGREMGLVAGALERLAGVLEDEARAALARATELERLARLAAQAGAG